MPPKNTTNILKTLRSLMKNTSYVVERIDAYIISSADAHQNEYIADCDQRRAYVSGFTGTAGTAIVTDTNAALWTDGRYFLQAATQLDANWTLMKDGLPDTLSQGDWLCKTLATGARVGVDPFVLSVESWKSLAKQLKSSGCAMVPVAQNLIDLVWTDRPSPPNNSLMMMSEVYTGRSWQAKVTEIREKLTSKKAIALVVNALDEVAYLFNMRGSDIPYNPVFFAYAVVTMDEVCLFIDESKVDKAVQTHLKGNGLRVTIKPYEDIRPYILSLNKSAQGKIWISDKASYGVASLVPKINRVQLPSPIAIMKAVKNTVEIEGMKKAHIKDAVTLCEYFLWLEKEVPKNYLNEVTAADKLEDIKRSQEDYVSLSFTTISSVGPHGAVIHYHPAEETALPLTTTEVYLCDSGAQYKDGTTDVTRTMHFGTPTRFEQECFTRVLKGHINLSSVIFPNGVKGNALDAQARTALWDVGLDYLHGTGHGVGSFLNVHEGPCRISPKADIADVPLEEGMVLSDEPGYYEDGSFGVRIENLVVVVKAKTEHNFRDKGFLTFEPLTLVPIQSKMLIPSLLTEKELNWLNDYHAKCRDVIGQALQDQGKMDVLQWLMRETEPLG